MLDGAERRDGREARWWRTRITITRAWPELELSGLASALAMLDRAGRDAEALGDPLLVALGHIQTGTLHGRVGDWASCVEALLRIDEEAAGLDAAQRWAYHLNLGQAWLGVGRPADAGAHFETARSIAAAEHLTDLEFKARHNSGVVAFVEGDLPRALVLMREADAMDTTVSRDRARLDHAEVLLEAGLVDGARTMLAQALEVARRDGHRLEEGETSLRLARCDLLAGDLDGARRHALAAGAAYRSRGADELVLEAELVGATVDVAEQRDLPSVVAGLARRADRGASPVTDTADRRAARLEAEARVLLGDLVGADRVLARLGGIVERSLPAALHEALVRSRLAEARGHHDEAVARLAEGNRLLAAHQFQSASLDVRAALALHGRRLAALDIELAMAGADEDPVTFLETVERWRAISHRINPATAPDDPALLTATRELRRLRQLASEGAATADLTGRVHELETEVAQREWSLVVASGDAADRPVERVELRAALTDDRTTAVAFVEVGEDLHQVVATADGIHVERVGSVAEVVGLVTRLRRDLRARATVAPSAPMASVLERATSSSLAAVDRTLNPGGAADGRVVVVPSHSLGAMPWSLMPSLRGRPVTVAPSLTRWVRGAAGPGGERAGPPVAALYGPGLARTIPEVRAVAAAWGLQVPAGARAATSDDVRRALGEARVVHLGAHGTHEGQSPLFSWVAMADGPVFAHEFPRPVLAEHVVLSACDVGQFSTRAGDEPLGLATALLSLGATSVLAAVAPVADDVAHDAMVAYHRFLADGADAAAAWAAVVEGEPSAGVFCLYGSDWRVAPGHRSGS